METERKMLVKKKKVKRKERNLKGKAKIVFGRTKKKLKTERECGEERT